MNLFGRFRKFFCVFLLFMLAFCLCYRNLQGVSVLPVLFYGTLFIGYRSSIKVVSYELSVFSYRLSIMGCYSAGYGDIGLMCQFAGYLFGRFRGMEKTSAIAEEKTSGDKLGFVGIQLRQIFFKLHLLLLSWVTDELDLFVCFLAQSLQHSRQKCFEKLRKAKNMENLSSVASAGALQMDYMKLLITQLRNQNPMDPVNNNEMAAQLAQFSQLQQLEDLNKSFSKVLGSVQKDYAGTLLGKEVSYKSDEPDSSEILSGVVQKVTNKGDGEVLLSVGDTTIGLNDIIDVANK